MVADKQRQKASLASKKATVIFVLFLAGMLSSFSFANDASQYLSTYHEDLGWLDKRPVYYEMIYPNGVKQDKKDQIIDLVERLLRGEEVPTTLATNVIGQIIFEGKVIKLKFYLMEGQRGVPVKGKDKEKIEDRLKRQVLENLFHRRNNYDPRKSVVTEYNGTPLSYSILRDGEELKKEDYGNTLDTSVTKLLMGEPTPEFSVTETGQIIFDDTPVQIEFWYADGNDIDATDRLEIEKTLRQHTMWVLFDDTLPIANTIDELAVDDDPVEADLELSDAQPVPSIRTKTQPPDDEMDRQPTINDFFEDGQSDSSPAKGVGSIIDSGDAPSIRSVVPQRAVAVNNNTSLNNALPTPKGCEGYQFHGEAQSLIELGRSSVTISWGGRGAEHGINDRCGP